MNMSLVVYRFLSWCVGPVECEIIMSGFWCLVVFFFFGWEWISIL